MCYENHHPSVLFALKVPIEIIYSLEDKTFENHCRNLIYVMTFWLWERNA